LNSIGFNKFSAFVAQIVWFLGMQHLQYAFRNVFEVCQEVHYETLPRENLDLFITTALIDNNGKTQEI